MRATTLLLGFGLALCGAPAPLCAQEAPDAYQAALVCWERLDYACAAELFTAAERAADPADVPRRVLILRRLAECQLALGRWAEAVDAFERLLALDSTYRLDEPGVSPKIAEALAQARRRREQQTPPAPTKPVTAPTETSGGRPLQVGLGAGVKLLTGGDADLLRPGPLIELEVAGGVSEPWWLSGGVRYASHDLTNGGQTLHLIGGWLGGGLGWTLGLVRLLALAGAGVAHWMVPDSGGQTGLLLLLRLGADFELASQIRLGLVVTPDWAIDVAAGRTSFSIGLGARLSLAF